MLRISTTKPVTSFMSANSYCELAAESCGNYWILRFNADGSETRMRNMSALTEFPSTSLTRELEAFAGLLRFVIREYMTTKDVQLKRARFWEVSDVLNGRKRA